MRSENVQAARRLLGAVAERDLGTILELVDPEIEWRSFLAAFLEGGAYRGHEGMRRYVADLQEAWDYLRPEVDDLLDAGDVILGVGQIHYRGKGSGVETTTSVGWVFRFRAG